MSERVSSFAIIVSCGVVLSNIVVASSGTFGAYAPVRMESVWLLIAALASGFILGIVTRDDATVILYGVFLMALVAVLGFVATLLAVALLSGSALVDVILLFALQQSFPRLISISIFGYVGAFTAVLLRLLSGRL